MGNQLYNSRVPDSGWLPMKIVCKNPYELRNDGSTSDMIVGLELLAYIK